MRYRAVVFDMDGTLLDTLEDLADAVNHVLEERGFPPHEIGAYRHFVGGGAGLLIARALPEECRNETLVGECRAAFLARYRERWDVKTRLYPQMPELLDALACQKLRLAVLSNKPEEFTSLCARRYLSAWPFEVVLGQQPALPTKPDPRGALQIADTLGVPASEFLYLGDSGIDMETATRAGMFPIGALWGYRSSDELRSHGARVTIENPLDLLGLLE